MALAPVEAPEVVMAESVDHAVSAFGDGDGVTVLGGGTILMVELVHGRLAPQRVLVLDRAQMGGVRTQGDRIVVGAMTTVAELEAAVEPLATAARGVADPEIRAQATVGGNLCAPPGAESPRGDLQAAFIALGGEVRSVGAGGERTEPVEALLAAGAEGRLVLDVSFEPPQAGAYAEVRRPHAHAYTVLAVCGARRASGVRLGVSGAGPRAVRLGSVEEALAAGSDVATAAALATDDVAPADDALASGWYRRQVLPVLVTRVLKDLDGGAR